MGILMRLQRPFLALFTCVLLTGTCFASSDFQSLTQRRALADLETIRNVFDVKYAPTKWKKQFANWDLDEAIEEAKNRIESMSNPSLKECQVVIRDFFNSTRDYHVGVRFYSTEGASLPFVVKGAENRYFVCDVDNSLFFSHDFPFEEGDEILTFGGEPVGEVIEELRVNEYGMNTLETDQALAEMSLTNRHGAMGHHIPRGSLEITGLKKDTQEEIIATLEWDYVPEKIRDFSKLGFNTHFDASSLSKEEGGCLLLKKGQFFDKFMVFHSWDRSYVGARTQMSPHTLGARSSYLPNLGRRIWKTGSDWIFDAYIFETELGKRVGYIRLPHYMGDIEELEEFGQIMNYFQRRTDALVIDQINNPGGSVFYLYALASTLTDKPIPSPKHRISLTQEEVHTALFLLPYLEHVRDDSSARSVLGEEVGGYPVNYEFVHLMRRFCHFLIDQWSQGNLYTEPTHLFGVDMIKPHPRYRYKKPILLLVNSLNFSGGDFFPAILQDSKRARLMGTRTAGAGGYVLSTSFPNHSGIKGFVLTGSHAERIDNNPIENLGVKPDVVYNLSVEDLQGHYQPYADRILEEIESLIEK
ncbi:MAG: hypothetical protein S4CHLAM2_15730 [Chlamydiales bacterium]|nr:hypothetical protein [Chlamydiales bacterium]